MTSPLASGAKINRPGNMVRRYLTEIGAIRKFGRGKVAVKPPEADLGHFELREMTTQALTQWPPRALQAPLR